MLLLYHTSCVDASALWVRVYEYKGETIKNCSLDQSIFLVISYTERGYYISYTNSFLSSFLALYTLLNTVPTGTPNFTAASG